MSTHDLGKWYEDGEYVVRQGDRGNSMYVIQKGQLEVFVEREGHPVKLNTLGEGDFFGEMALFDHGVRTASVRAAGRALVLTVDRRTLMRRVKEDPLVALHIIETLCMRIKSLGGELAGLKAHAEGSSAAA